MALAQSATSRATRLVSKSDELLLLILKVENNLMSQYTSIYSLSFQHSATPVVFDVAILHLKASKRVFCIQFQRIDVPNQQNSQLLKTLQGLFPAHMVVFKSSNKFALKQNRAFFCVTFNLFFFQPNLLYKLIISHQLQN